MNIGSLILSSPLLLAPMAGVTDPVFRALCARFGAGLTCTEMVSAKGLFYKSEHTADLLIPSGAHPEAAQLFGSDPEIMAREIASPLLAPFDVIDLNMGCPARKITANGEGGALLRDLPLARSIMEACVRASKKPVTVKLRAGWETNDAVAFARAAQDAGIAAVTVHGRTVTQGYSGSADKAIIRAVKDSVSIPVIGNGDVCDAQSARAMLEETHCDAVMIGRAAQGRPWIFSEILAGLNGTPFALSFIEKMEIARFHGVELARLRGENTAMRQMRKHLAWYTHGMRRAAAVRGSMNAVSTLGEFHELVDRIESFYKD